MSSVRSASVSACVMLLLVLGTALLGAEDWPEYRGKGRAGVWNETGIVETFPAAGLPVLWRTPINRGFSGPAVAGGRVFVTDYRETQNPKGIERAVALDEATGKILWTYEWPAHYGGIMWPVGPRATPTVDGDRVYVLGVNGKLFCLDVKTGAVLWKKDYAVDFGTDTNTWAFNYGFTSAPIVDGNRVIAMVGGQPNGKVVALDRKTGKELWRALSSDTELGAAQPLVIQTGEIRQLIVWYPGAVASLDPENGKVYWQQEWRVGGSASAPMPVQAGLNLFFTTFYDGGLMLSLDPRKVSASLMWKGKSNNELQTDGLHSTLSTPVIVGDHIYGICSYGQFRCLRVKTGERVWESQALTKERARWATGHIVRNGDRLFVNNDRGDLIIVNPSPAGYQEISRTTLIKPTSPPGNRRQLVNVNWSHPAYANKHIYARNDEEIICLSLAKDGR
jgi:outer membrane protein assembly factor BamB